MKHPPYPKYKPSGVEWLGDVPEGWGVKRLKYLLDAPLKYGANEAAELDDPDLPRYVRITDIDDEDGLRSETFRSLPISVAKEYLLREGDLLFARSGATSGKTFLYRDSWGECAYAGYLIRARFDTGKTVAKFIRYFTASSNYWQWLASVFIQATIQNVSAERYASLFLSLPPLPEQRTIATFLDAKTATIDTLIAKKRALIEKLKEKRAALISHTVTRGLPPEAAIAAGVDPKPRLKASGVEWLGDVPEGWGVKKIKHVGRTRYGLGEPPEYVDEGLPFIRATDIFRGKIDLDVVKKVSPEDIPWSRKPQLKFHEILVVRSGAYTGDSAIITAEVVDCIAGYDMVLTIRAAFAPFVAWVLLSKYVLQGQIYLERMRAAQPHLNAEELGECVVLIPPLPEQHAIAAYLDRETVRIDQMITKAEEVIERVREYRSALITAAVTGKIDVRSSEQSIGQLSC